MPLGFGIVSQYGVFRLQLDLNLNLILVYTCIYTRVCLEAQYTASNQPTASYYQTTSNEENCSSPPLALPGRSP